jgi:hypothetical protein
MSAKAQGMFSSRGPSITEALRNGLAKTALLDDAMLLLNASPERLGVYAYCFCRAW